MKLENIKSLINNSGKKLAQYVIPKGLISNSVKEVARYIVSGALIVGMIGYVLNNLNENYKKNNLEKIVQKAPFQERVLDAMKDRSNVKREGIFQYVDINNDGRYDAVVFPAPVRFGLQEIIKLKEEDIKYEKRK